MAAQKKRVLEGTEIDDNSSDSSVSDDEQMEEGEVQVDFEARIPTDSDFHGIRKLLQQLFLKAHIDISELAEAIIQLGSIGSVIKQCDLPDDSDDDDDDDETFGVTSVISLKQNKNCIKEILKLLLDSCQKYGCNDGVKMLNSVVDDPKKHAGLIIAERFVNIPPQISVPVYETLSKEIKEMSKKDSKFRFTHYVMISKLYKFEPDQQAKGDECLIHANAEEALFKENGHLLCEYSVENESSDTSWSKTDVEMKPYRQIILLTAESFNDVVLKIKDTFVGT